MGERPTTGQNTFKKADSWSTVSKKLPANARKRHILALCGDPKAFLYYKQRHLMERELPELRSRQLSEDKGKSLTPSLRKHPILPRSPSPPPKQPPQSTRDQLFHRVVKACVNTPSAKDLESVIDRERRSESVSMRLWKRGQDRFKRIRAHDPDLLVPLYFLDKEAEAYYEADVLHTAQSRRENASPVQRLLRSGRKSNLVLAN